MPAADSRLESRAALFVSLLAVLSACGGESVGSGTGGGSGQAGASGSGAVGGASASGGTGGSVGGTGGSVGGTGGSVGGTGGSIGGTGGTGGSVGGTGGSAAGMAGQGGADPCLVPAESGPCQAYIERWYFNAERGICERFVYGGCGGNENNFESLAACSAACGGHGETDPTACEEPYECVVTAARCCGGNNPPTLGDLTAVNSKSLTDFTAPCALVDCASTIGPIPAYFGATCSAGHCIAFDVRGEEYTSCTSSDQCVLRNGLGCCEACTGQSEDFVAVRADARLTELLCGKGPVGCAACSPRAEGFSAACISGNCEVLLQPK